MANAPCPLNLCGGTGWLARYETAWVAYYSHGDPDLKPERVPDEEMECPHVALQAALEGADRLRERIRQMEVHHAQDLMLLHSAPDPGCTAAQGEVARLRERLETEVAFSMWLRPTDHWQILRDKFDRDDQCGCNEILRGMARTFLQGAPDPGHGESVRPADHPSPVEVGGREARAGIPGGGRKPRSGTSGHPPAGQEAQAEQPVRDSAPATHSPPAGTSPPIGSTTMPENCPGCNHPMAEHAEESRPVGCQRVGHEDGATIICGCRVVQHDYGTPAGTSPPEGSDAPAKRPDLLEAAKAVVKAIHYRPGAWTDRAKCLLDLADAIAALEARPAGAPARPCCPYPPQVCPCHELGTDYERGCRACAPPPVAAPAEKPCPRCGGLKAIVIHEDCSCTNPRCDSMVETLSTCPDCTGAGKAPHDSGSALGAGIGDGRRTSGAEPGPARVPGVPPAGADKGRAGTPEVGDPPGSPLPSPSPAETPAPTSNAPGKGVRRHPPESGHDECGICGLCEEDPAEGGCTVPHCPGDHTPAPTAEAPGPGKGGRGHAGNSEPQGGSEEAPPGPARRGPPTSAPPPQRPGASEDTEG